MNIKKYILDFRNIEHHSEVHTIIKDCFDFPDYYGRNWSAFWDCMTELYGPAIHIEILGLDVLEKKYNNYASKLTEILKRFKHYVKIFEDSIKIEIVSGDTRIEIK